MARPNGIMAEACISSVGRRDSLVFLLVLRLYSVIIHSTAIIHWLLSSPSLPLLLTINPTLLRNVMRTSASLKLAPGALQIGLLLLLLFFCTPGSKNPGG